ncbi:hypothetical protein EVAR_59908_1 [Eumeta japonica]|uniref:Uncharacterized protein n=1 Tax=Eumeta variegata TaxID=151549 RepID=A0A4C2AFE7_EUMVA|nr:hypothetical protein EVAR_59908_1 [Eumeta japonica]
MMRAVSISATSDSEGLHILNDNTPTFEVYRDRPQSVMDAAPLYWIERRDGRWSETTSSDHNAVTPAAEGRSGPGLSLATSLQYERLDGPSSQQPWMLLLMNGPDHRDGEICGLVRPTRRGC